MSETPNPFRIWMGKRNHSYLTIEAATAAALRHAQHTGQDVTITERKEEQYGESYSNYRRVSPDGTIAHWVPNEWLQLNEVKTEDGRIVSIQA